MASSGPLLWDMPALCGYCLRTGNNCPAIVQTALEQMDRLCATTGRNQACYGNSDLSATVSQGTTFDRAGDIIGLDALESLSASPLDATGNSWGVALMQVQANLPDTQPGQNVTMLIFGNATLEKVAAPTRATSADQPGPSGATIEVVTAGNNAVNLRNGPGTSFTVIGSLRAGVTATGYGRTRDNNWVRVELPDGVNGWVFAELVQAPNVETLPILESATATTSAATTLTLGETIQGRITDTNYEIAYAFDGIEGEAIDIFMSSPVDQLDTYLILRDDQGNELASNDDYVIEGGDGLYNSAIVAYRLPRTGRYTILATRYGFEQSSGASSQGNFSLTVDLNGTLNYVAPMQAFYFTSGIGRADCGEVTTDGLLLQSPEGTGEVRFLINEVRIELGSTAYLTTASGNFLEMYMIEGRGRVEAFEQGQFVPAGSRVRIPLNADGRAAGPPEDPEPYDEAPLLSLPLSGLARPITVAEPVDPFDILTGDVVISLSWDNSADLDLVLIEPDGSQVYYLNPSSLSGAALDVDANANCDRNFGTRENISWPSGQPRLGEHIIYVQEYDNCEAGPANWKLTVTVGNRIILSESGNNVPAEFRFNR